MSQILYPHSPCASTATKHARGNNAPPTIAMITHEDPLFVLRFLGYPVSRTNANAGNFVFAMKLYIC